MQYIFDIERRESASAKPWHQRILYETQNANETVATALLHMNHTPNLCDAEGNPVESISWDVGCLQKKCGACAMRINGQPRLACDAFLKEFKAGKPIFLEPLRKFPVIKDLITDRSILFENLKTLRVWIGENGEIRERNLDWAYDASRCLQCGCCLEACPNYDPGGYFMGAAGYAPNARLLSTFSREEREDLRENYQKHIYAGCGKSLACAKVCPAGIDLDLLLSRSNAIAVWRRKTS